MTVPEEHLNGHGPKTRQAPANPYLDALSGDQPADLASFQLNTDPYANVLPQPASLVVDDGDEDGEPRRRRPFLIATSIVLVAVLILPPVMAELFSRFFN